MIIIKKIIQATLQAKLTVSTTTPAIQGQIQNRYQPRKKKNRNQPVHKHSLILIFSEMIHPYISFQARITKVP